MIPVNPDVMQARGCSKWRIVKIEYKFGSPEPHPEKNFFRKVGPGKVPDPYFARPGAPNLGRAVQIWHTPSTGAPKPPAPLIPQPPSHWRGFRQRH